MPDTRYLRVRNFEKFQSFNGRNLKQNPNPLWIKVYYALLADRMFFRLPDAQKFHVIGMFMIASQCNNKIPSDMDWLQHQMGATTKLDLAVLLESRFIEWIEPDGPATPTLPDIVKQAQSETAPIIVQSELSPLERRKYSDGCNQSRVEKNRVEKKIHTRTASERSLIPDDAFQRLWAKYPVKDGRKQAQRHFSASVKTEQDLSDCVTALEHYLAHLQVPGNEWKRPKNGETWFNNWRDWVDWQEPDLVPAEDPKAIEEVRKIFRKGTS